MHRRTAQRLSAALAASVLLVGAAACGDDDDGGDTTPGTEEPSSTEPSSTEPSSTEPATTEATTEPATTEPATTEATTEPATTEPATTEPATTAAADGIGAFCDAEIEVEKAVSTQDPAAIEPAFQTLSETAPDDVSEPVDTAIAEAQEFLASGGEPTPAFNEAYAQVLEYVKGNCGFTDLSTAASDYEFGGLPEEIAAGPAVITLENIGTEFHEIAVMRIADDTSETVEEILALPERRARQLLDPSVNAGAFAAPGDTGYTAVDLPPGRYLVACFIPEGTTPEAMEEMETGGTEPQGQPHFMLGMSAELVVT